MSSCYFHADIIQYSSCSMKIFRFYFTGTLVCYYYMNADANQINDPSPAWKSRFKLHVRVQECQFGSYCICLFGTDSRSVKRIMRAALNLWLI